jgi:threonine dehydrogenase-like Zn-dependent dehydrogenase
MRIRRIVFPESGRAQLQDDQLDESSLGAGQVLVEQEYTVVSAGTELAIQSGLEKWAPLPFTPGYGSVGRVLAAGPGMERLSVGDRVFAHGPHCSHAIVGGLVLPVPEDLDPKLAVVGRMAQVAFTALRVSEVELGDWVAVQGLGQVGNMAAQLFGLQGCEVIGVDVAASRLETARQCGIGRVVNAAECDPVAAVAELTGGRLCQAVVEATGVTDLALTAARMAGLKSEVILLGSPRRHASFDALELLQRVHLWDQGVVTLKGAHEWRFPVCQDPGGFVKHSLERNVRLYFDLARRGKLAVEPLISHVADPAECDAIYAGLRSGDPTYVGVVFDWS